MVRDAVTSTRIERGLLIGLVAELVLLIGFDFLSPAAAQLRAHQPWTAWLTVRSEGAPKTPSIFLLHYSWDRRKLHLVRMPDKRPPPRPPNDSGTAESRRATGQLKKSFLPISPSRADDLRAWDPQVSLWQAVSVNGPLLRWPSAPPLTETSAGLKAWLAARPRGLRFWMAVPRLALSTHLSNNGPVGYYDTWVLARELYRLPARNIRSHDLASAAELSTLLARLDERAERPSKDRMAVAVLNASSEPGVALQATKVLRWRNVDVVDFGNAAAPSPSTRLIDHGATDAEIETLLRQLGCGDLDIVEALDGGRRERATIVLGRDYARCSLFRGAMKGI